MLFIPDIPDQTGVSDLSSLSRWMDITTASLGALQSVDRQTEREGGREGVGGRGPPGGERIESQVLGRH